MSLVSIQDKHWKCTEKHQHLTCRDRQVRLGTEVSVSNVGQQLQVCNPI
jgi:hypothetical protein